MATEARIRTILVDDEAPARARLRQLLKPEPDFVVVAECTNGNQAVESIKIEQPDLVFLDVQMPRLNGLQVCQALSAANVALAADRFRHRLRFLCSQGVRVARRRLPAQAIR